MNKQSKVFCIGLGKLGLMYSQILCEAGYYVFGNDININTKEQIFKNQKNIEPKINQLIKKNKKNFLFIDNFKKGIIETSACILILPTPSKKNHEFDNSYIFDCLKNIGQFLKYKKKYVINITSTVNPGSCNLFVKFLEKNYLLKHGREFVLTYNPHLIALGSIYSDIINSKLVIVGSDLNYGHKFLKKFYSKIYKKKINKLKFVNLLEAEISKIAINSFVTMKISFSNTLSQLADNQKNINVSKIIEVVGSDSRIGNKYLGLGGQFSGPCFPRDSLNFAAYLKKLKTNNYIPLAVEKVNQLQIARYLKFIKIYSRIFKKEPSIGICGIAYKNNTTLTEFSPGINIMRRIHRKSNVFIYDKKEVLDNFKCKFNFNYCYNLKKFFKLSDIIFLCYPNKNFKKIQSFKSVNKKVILDLWNFLKIKQKKIIYHALGVSSKQNKLLKV